MVRFQSLFISIYSLVCRYGASLTSSLFRSGTSSPSKSLKYFTNRVVRFSPPCVCTQVCGLHFRCLANVNFDIFQFWFFQKHSFCVVYCLHKQYSLNIFSHMNSHVVNTNFFWCGKQFWPLEAVWEKGGSNHNLPFWDFFADRTGRERMRQ